MSLTQQEKAGITMRARNAFRSTFGEDTYEVVSLLSEGYSTTEVSDITQISRTSVSAYKANLTRGTYDWSNHNNGTNYSIAACNF